MSESTGRMVIEFYDHKDPVVSCEGVVDPGNMQTLIFHIRTQYETGYLFPRRDEEVKMEAERKEQVKKDRAQAETERLKALAVDAQNAQEAEEANREITRKKKERVKLENQKIEAERTIRREEGKSTNPDTLSNAQEALEAVTEQLKDFDEANKGEAKDDREDREDGGEEGADAEGSTGADEQPDVDADDASEDGEGSESADEADREEDSDSSSAS
jgi:hypothetical protein